MGNSHRQNADSANRSTRLVCAADPETPFPVLLDLAMEFPETVIHNPAFRVGLVSNPGDLNAAHPIALACLITSPAMTVELEALIKELLRAAGLMPPSLTAYLDKWHSRGARRIAVDATAPAASCPDLKVDIERTVRGQCILGRRLGWNDFECPLDSWNGNTEYSDTPLSLKARTAEGKTVRSSLALLIADWAPDPDLTSYKVNADTAEVNLIDSAETTAQDVRVIIEGPDSTGSGVASFEEGDEECALHTDVRDRVRDAAAPLMKLAQSLPADRVLVMLSGDKTRIATGTLSQIQKGLVHVLAEFEDLADFEDNYDLSAETVTGFTHLLTEVVPVRGDDIVNGGGDTLLEHLERVPGGLKALGGKDAAKELDFKLMGATVVEGTAHESGSWGDPSESLVLVNAAGDLAAVFCWVGWSTQIKASIALDPMAQADSH